MPLARCSFRSSSAVMPSTCCRFASVQGVAINFTPDDWRVTVPIYVAYGSLAVSVGWLSEQLHSYYQRLMQHARLAAIGEVAVTIRHEVNNALTAIVAEAALLREDSELSEQNRAGASVIHDAAMEIAAEVTVPTMSHRSGRKMAPTTAHFHHRVSPSPSGGSLRNFSRK